MPTCDLQPFVTLLQTAFLFLQLSIGTPSQQSAMQMATDAVNKTQVAITQCSVAPMPQSPSATPIAPDSTPVSTPSQPIQQIQLQPKKMNTLEIISPFANKGIGAYHRALSLNEDPVLSADETTIELGLIVRGEDGNALRDVAVDVTASDASQNKTMDATGNVVPIYKNGVKQQTSYYPYRYQFKTAGDHTITFKVGDVEQSVTLSVASK